jgi:hypothetical protein
MMSPGRHLRRNWLLATACALALAGVAPGAAYASATTVTPGEAIFNVAMSVRTGATFTTPIGTITCSESTSRGAVPAAPDNRDEGEAEAGGTVPLRFEPAAFSGCSFPGASSVTVARNASEGWSASALAGTEEKDVVTIVLPEEALRITIVNAHGTCTISAPTSTVPAPGDWTDGAGGSASTAVVGTQLDFRSSGTCIAHCAALEGTGFMNFGISYDFTNAERGGASIVF